MHYLNREVANDQKREGLRLLPWSPYIIILHKYFCKEPKRLLIKPDTILLQLPLSFNLLHTFLDSLHNMLRIPRAERRLRHTHIHL